MDKELEFFIKDNYKVLETLLKNEVVLKGEKVVPLSQDDIAEITGFSKAKVNEIIKELINRDYVKFLAAGKYNICDKAKKIYDYFENMSR